MASMGMRVAWMVGRRGLQAGSCAAGSITRGIPTRLAIEPRAVRVLGPLAARMASSTSTPPTPPPTGGPGPGADPSGSGSGSSDGDGATDGAPAADPGGGSGPSAEEPLGRPPSRRAGSLRRGRRFRVQQNVATVGGGGGGGRQARSTVTEAELEQLKRLPDDVMLRTEGLERLIVQCGPRSPPPPL